jgi:hypothetical protein
VVPKYSAVIPGISNSEEIALAADHRNMVKYRSSEDENFRKVARRIAWMMNALDKVDKNWKTWERIKGKLVRVDFS